MRLSILTCARKNSLLRRNYWLNSREIFTNNKLLAKYNRNIDKFDKSNGVDDQDKFKND